MADELAALNLDAAQTTGVNRLIENAILTAREDAKLEFRAGVAGSRRPDVFDPETMSISTFFDTFEPFKLLMNMTGVNAMNTFLTYLDRKSRTTLASQDLTNIVDWDQFKLRVCEILSSPREAVQARFEIKKASQRPDETVAQFGDRLIDLGRLGFKADENIARESALKDALSGGVLRDEIAVHLISNLDKTLQQCLEEAINLDSAYRARLTLKEGDGISVSVMKTERYQEQPSTDYLRSVNAIETQPPLAPRAPEHPPIHPGYNTPYNQHAYDHSSANTPRRPYNGAYARNEVICYCCNQPGHYSTECPMNANVRDQFRPRPRSREPLFCFYCGKQGHSLSVCRKKIYEDKQRDRMTNDRRDNWGGRDQRQVYNPSYQYGPGQSQLGQYESPPAAFSSSDPRSTPLPASAQQAYNVAVERHTSRSVDGRQQSTNFNSAASPAPEHMGDRRVRFSGINQPAASNYVNTAPYHQAQSMSPQMDQLGPRSNSTVPKN